MVEDDTSSSGVMVELVSVAKGIVEQNKRTTIATLALLVVMIRARQVLLQRYRLGACVSISCGLVPTGQYPHFLRVS